jgi:putative toxin-antitoxin system antitoxin component (TIGR02293 family)
MITAGKIAEVLGLKGAVRSLGELTEIVSRGLPKSALRHCVVRVVSAPRERREVMCRIVPAATYKRRKQHLRPEESERTERLARVIATAEHVWGDPAEARRFLTTPHPELNGKTALEASYAELGARQVEELLWKLFYGLPA